MLNETLSMLTVPDCVAASNSITADLTLSVVVLAVLAVILMFTALIYYKDYSLRRKFILTKKQEQDFQEWLDDRKKFMGD